MEYENILYERIGWVARISHNRPRVRNAESTALLDELDNALSRALDDNAVRVIIIAGVGDHFSAGHDLKEAMTERADYTVEQRWAYEEKRYYGYALRIWDAPKPTIAQVQGACIGGAFMVANVCDLVVAADDVQFSDPVCQSLASASVEVLVHPWVMGLRRAKEFLFTGDPIDADEAFRIGMVNRVVPRASLEEATLALAEHIARTPPFALAMTKRSLNRTADIQGFRTSLAAHFETHQLTHVTRETQDIRRGGAVKALERGRVE
jgi:enoyl-CoA hydratase